MKLIKISAFFLFIIGFGISAQAQVKNGESNLSFEDSVIKSFKINKNVSTFVVKGTSSMHDWEMISKTFDGTIELILTEENLNIKSVNVKIASESLKSDKKLMDKKCYDALKTDKYPTIYYQFKSIESLKLESKDKYVATLNGVLTIAGKSKNISTLVEIITKGDSLSIISLNLKGEQPLKMSDFDVIPPTALFGTIKTGNEITIEFNLNYI